VSEGLKVVRLALEHITEDPRLQRRKLKPAVVKNYAQALRRGDSLPAVKVVRVADDKYYLVDGYHRLAATRQLNGVATIETEIIEGTFDDALWHSWAANRDHGVRRTRQETRAAVHAALEHPTWKKKTDRAIAKHIGCDHKTVGAMRRTLGRQSGEFPTPRRKPGTSKSAILKACQLLASAQPEQLGWFEESESAILRGGYDSLVRLLGLPDPPAKLTSTLMRAVQ